MEIVIDGIVYVPKQEDAKVKVEPVVLEEHYKFEVHAENLGDMNWNDAVKAVEKLGDGWRLPTIEECFIIYRHELITEASYWSSTEYGSSYAWYFYFDYGIAYNYGFKGTTNYVRAVRSI